MVALVDRYRCCRRRWHPLPSAPSSVLRGSLLAQAYMVSRASGQPEFTSNSSQWYLRSAIAVITCFYRLDCAFPSMFVASKAPRLGFHHNSAHLCPTYKPAICNTALRPDGLRVAAVLPQNAAPAE